LLAARPPRDWGEKEENRFRVQLGQYAAHFLRAEKATFGTGKSADSQAIRVCLTRADGTEVARIVSRRRIDDARQNEVRAKLADLINLNGSDSLAILYDILMENEK
jgi:hypothetical protein